MGEQVAGADGAAGALHAVRHAGGAVTVAGGECLADAFGFAAEAGVEVAQHLFVKCSLVHHAAQAIADIDARNGREISG